MDDRGFALLSTIRQPTDLSILRGALVPYPPIPWSFVPFAPCRAPSFQPRKVVLQQLTADPVAQKLPLYDRVVIVESGIDPRELNFVH